jgi:CheY-like chemotaxis protein
LPICRRHPNLILLDLPMPGLNGEETFRELRHINTRACCCRPVTVMMRLRRVSAATARWASFKKPYDAGQLVREVKRYLAQPPAG